jgi:DNA polymerase
MFTEPRLSGDQELLCQTVTNELERKSRLLSELGVTAKQLGSNNTFSQLLEALGIEVGYKSGTNGPIPAFAKSDQFMRDLLDSNDEAVAALAEARLETKSSITSTRAQRFLECAQRGPMPVYLNYCLSGAMEIVVATPNGWHYSSLDTLQPWERVWDGESFVEHRGLVRRGRKTVIEWDGIVATPDHVSWEQSGARTTIAGAKKQRIPLMGATLPRDADWRLAYNLPDSATPARARDLPLQMQLRSCNTDFQFSAAPGGGLQTLCAITGSYESDQQKSGEPLQQYEAAVRMGRTQTLAPLRRPGDTEQVCVTERVHSVRSEGAASSGLQRSGSRSDKQRWPLRTRKFKIGHTFRECPQFDSEQEIEVYDIYMCGPRNRFVANGKLVSNCGAHTTRWSGGDQMNWQNLPKKGDMRKAIKAPPGHVIVKVDSSQCECRYLNFIAKQHNIIDAFREGRDVYCELATGIFGRPITKADAGERFIGKRIELGGGYGVGKERMFNTLLSDIRSNDIKFDLIREVSDRGHDVYRATHARVKALWYDGDTILQWLSAGSRHEAPFNYPIEIKNHKIILPNGAPMHYHLEWDEAQQSWKRKTRSGWRHMWGGSITENIIQALGRVAVGQTCLRVKDRLGVYPANLEHDAAVWVVPEKLTDQIAPVLADEMRRPLSWLAGCPLDAEASVGATYGKE